MRLVLLLTKIIIHTRLINGRCYVFLALLALSCFVGNSAFAADGSISPEVSSAQALKAQQKLQHNNLDISLNKDDTINLIDHMGVVQNDKLHVLMISDVSNPTEGVIWKIIFVNCATRKISFFEHSKFDFENMESIRYINSQVSWHTPEPHSPWARAVVVECP